jgi:FkbM family methyltransferase
MTKVNPGNISVRTINDAVSAFLDAFGTMFFLQVGGLDGVSFDPLRSHILSGQMSGLIIEPVSHYFEKLQKLYEGSDRIAVCNCAIFDKSGEQTMWRFNPASIESGLLGLPFAGISSFVMEDLLKDDGTLGIMFDPTVRVLLRTLVEAVTVQCLTFEDVLEKYGVSRIDLLQIDTEGYDLEILQMFDFVKYQPTIVHYEHMHLGPKDRATAETMLQAMGYRLYHTTYDTLAVRGLVMRPPAPVTQGALTVARNLYDREQPADALAICDYVLSVDAENSRALHLSAVALMATDDVDEALRRITTIAHSDRGFDPTLPDVVQIAKLAAQASNDASAVGNNERTASIIEALATLFPDFVPFLQVALDVNVALNRTDRVVSYAERLLKYEPDNIPARMTLIDQCRVKRDDVAETTHRVCLARILMDSDRSSAVKLDNIYIALSGLLCTELDDAKIGLVDELLSYVDDLPVDDATRAATDLLTFDAYYRTAIGGIDLKFVLSPSPSPMPWPDIAFAAADGRPLTPSEVQASAARRKAEVVFLVAADEVYVARYGDAFVRSVLRSADVPCLAVIFIAGKAGELAQVAAAFGIDDDRVVFAGDLSSPSPNQYHSLHSKGVNERPSAYYQCLRFSWLGYISECLRLPILVCDIDLVLQQGIADLLKAHADADVVFNRSDYILQAGSHMIANLVLVNPTEAAFRFTRFLRSYVDKSLHRERIDHFADQIALLMGWHHLQRIPAARIGYFEAYDINNVMFNSGNIATTRDIAAKYRFINFFASQGDIALDASALMDDEAIKPNQMDD